MKIFISWSGQKSQLFSLELRNWLASIFQSLDIWISQKDISIGTRWYISLTEALNNSNIGIVVLTKENLNSNWILFEAGVLSKSVDESRLIPILVDLKKSDLSGPLSFFQAINVEKDELYNLILTINNLTINNFRDQKTLDVVFEKWWPEFEQKIKEINAKDYPRKIPDFRVISTREITFLLLLQEGKTAAQIAESLSLSPGTVSSYIQNIKVKLGAKSTKEAIELAKYYEQGFLIKRLVLS